jgi:hypothetical protein
MRVLQPPDRLLANQAQQVVEKAKLWLKDPDPHQGNHHNADDVRQVESTPE